MNGWKRLRPSPAMLLAVIALVAALAGGAVGATLITGGQIKDKSITGKDVRNGSLTGAQIRNGTLGLTDLSKGARARLGAVGPGAGIAGQPGATGPQGPAGNTSTVPFFVTLDRGQTQELAKAGPLSLEAACASEIGEPSSPEPGTQPLILGQTATSADVVMAGVDTFNGDNGYLTPGAPGAYREMFRGPATTEVAPTAGSARAVLSPLDVPPSSPESLVGFIATKDGAYIGVDGTSLGLGLWYGGRACVFMGSYTFRTP
jgi:hypothetical protein